MTFLRSKSAFLMIFCAAAGACVHTPPGTSVEVALAKRPEVIRVPAPPQAIVAADSKKSRESAMRVPDKTDRVADAFSRGDFCMKAGKDEEAIAAFREAVQLDPNFTEAWGNLAILFEKTGQEKLAMEAFRKSKKIASQ